MVDWVDEELVVVGSAVVWALPPELELTDSVQREVVLVVLCVLVVLVVVDVLVLLVSPGPVVWVAAV